MAAFRVTYEIVTFESAENGDVDSRGFLSPGNWHHDDPAPMSFREALSLVPAGTCEDSGSWFTTVDADINYRTGEHETRSVHPPRSITPASYRRVKRILCGRGN